MNNYNIYLEIQNPKKQALDMKLESRACYLTNRRTEEQGTNNREPPGSPRVRVQATVEQCSEEAIADKAGVWHDGSVAGRGIWRLEHGQWGGTAALGYGRGEAQCGMG